MTTPTEPAPARPRWGLARRLGVQFASVYLLLFVVAQVPLRAVPAWRALVAWVGEHLFRTDVAAPFPVGSDTRYDYVQAFCFLVLAAAAALVWNRLDRRRPDYARLHRRLRTCIRFMLAAAMIVYGAFKVIKAQFPDPPLDRLVQPVGELWPMDLLWTFMGVSPTYNVFTGAAELAGGLLLTARRTTLLGALVCCGVLANVVLLNFSYHVPVKLVASHLLALSVVLIAPDLRRLADFFVLNRRAEPADLRPLFGDRAGLNRAALAVQAALVAGFTGLALLLASEARRTSGDLAPRSPLYGIWDVEEFAVGGTVRPPLVTDPTRWLRVIADRPGRLAIQSMDGRRRRYQAELDPGQDTLALTRGGAPAWRCVLSLRRPGPGLLELSGPFDGRDVRARLRRADESRFRRVLQPFDWVSDRPASDAWEEDG